MPQKDLIIDNLISSATKLDNNDAIAKLQDEKYVNTIKEVVEFLNSLGYEPSKKDSEFILDAEKQVYIALTKSLYFDYFTLYYVNINTGHYVRYTTDKGYDRLMIGETGNDFWHFVKVNIPKVIYKDDQEMLYEVLDRQRLINETSNGKAYEIIYRIIQNNKPEFVKLKATPIEKDRLVIGLSNINEQKLKEIEQKDMLKESITYTNIALALIKNYFRIYYVNTINDEYTQYSIDTESKRLVIEDEGVRFFEECIVQAKKYLPEQYQTKFLNLLKKENLLKELSENKKVGLEYKQYIGGFKEENLVNVSLLALKLFNDENHIIIAISNIDAKVKKEEEYAKTLEHEMALARKDALTGCFNRYSYLELEGILNKKIKQGKSLEFSVVICDINDLKIVNDTLGHEAGDRYIIDAKQMLSDVFHNSGIYRIGGDEFVLILEGSDYYKRDYLIEIIHKKSLYNKANNKVVLACGYSDFDNKIDRSFVSVFIRADQSMYQNKKELKQQN